MMLTSFILIFMAEMADKTQLLVLALSSAIPCAASSRA